MSWSVRDGKLQVKWTAVLPLCDNLHPSEYLLEWVKIPQAVHQTELQTSWQRVPNNVTITTLNGTSSLFSEALTNTLAHVETVHVYLLVLSQLAC